MPEKDFWVFPITYHLLGPYNHTEIKYHFDIFRLVAQFAYVFITLDQIRNAIMVQGDVNLQPLIQT